MTTQATGPNNEAIMVWSDIVGPKFLRHRKVIVQGGTLHSDAALALYPVRAGDRVLDVGCGFGDTTIEIARRVAPGGEVVGFDCVPPFLEIGRGDAAAAGITNARFELGDAQTHRFEPTFDRIFSRFGTMFFASAVHALRNLRTALKPGGLLTMVVWRARAVNEWVTVPREIVANHVPPPPDQGVTCGPGPFSMADVETVTQQLTVAGWRDIAFHPLELPFPAGSDIAGAIRLALDLGPAGELMRFGGEAAEAVRPAIEADLAKAYEGYLTPNGVVMTARSWCVAARRPD